MRLIRVLFAGVLMSAGISFLSAADKPAEQKPAAAHPRGDQLLAEYFQARTAAIAKRCLQDIQTAADWEAQKQQYRDQLQEMLGLTPWPERTPLNSQVTGRVEKEGIIVENVHFQASPGLYVTGNLYRPREVTKPLPAILYVCGHSVKKKGDVIYGNKTGYQQHGGWYARNGYVCLTIDTIQLGEIPGIHHGTHNLGMMWWHSRGYTPVGVETWNCMRAIDYLQSRAEVDPERIGLTGRSGGGSYSWFTAAMDERVKAVVPVAGITNMENHIVDGCIEGHCDCMFQTNLYGWDYPQLAALVAPRPLLISNQDKDRIFPLDGVVDVYMRTRRIYELFKATNKLGLCIAEGGHNDIQELQNDSFRWFNRFLKNDNSQIAMTADPLFELEELRVFKNGLPADERVTTVHEWFVPQANQLKAAGSRDDFSQKLKPAKELLTRQLDAAIGLLPADGNVNVKEVSTTLNDSKALRLRHYKFESAVPYQLSIFVLDHGEDKTAQPITIHVLDQAGWDKTVAKLAGAFPEAGLTASPEAAGEKLAAKFSGTLVYFAPRGIGETRWSETDVKKVTHIQRRFALLGTTLALARAEDVANAVTAVREVLAAKHETLTLDGSNEAASWALHAAFLKGGIASLLLTDLPDSSGKGPQYLGLERLASLNDVLAGVVADSTTVQLTRTASPDATTKSPTESLKADTIRLGIQGITTP